MDISTSALPWEPLAIDQVAELLADVPVRWWLAGGAALERWLGRSIRERRNIDVGVVAGDLAALVDHLPEGFSAWAPSGAAEADGVVPFAEAPGDAGLHPVLIRDDAREAWVLQVDVEDGSPRAWVYKRDPRLTQEWERAVLDVGGVPTGAPEIQLVWKALRPRAEDESDRDAVLPELSDDARAFYETALLRIHPHSTWSIHIRSPHAPAKASWNRGSRA